MYIAIFAEANVFNALNIALKEDGNRIFGFPVDTQLEYGLERGNIIVCDLNSFLPDDANVNTTVNSAIEIAKRLIDCPSPPSRMIFTILYSGNSNDHFTKTMKLFNEWAVKVDFKNWQYCFAARPAVDPSDYSFCFDNGLMECPWDEKKTCECSKYPWCSMVKCLRFKILQEPPNAFES